MHNLEGRIQGRDASLLGELSWCQQTCLNRASDAFSEASELSLTPWLHLCCAGMMGLTQLLVPAVPSSLQPSEHGVKLCSGLWCQGYYGQEDRIGATAGDTSSGTWLEVWEQPVFSNEDKKLVLIVGLTLGGL
jgi:hypothetical protein